MPPILEGSQSVIKSFHRREGSVFNRDDVHKNIPMPLEAVISSIRDHSNADNVVRLRFHWHT